MLKRLAKDENSSPDAPSGRERQGDSSESIVRAVAVAEPVASKSTDAVSLNGQHKGMERAEGESSTEDNAIGDEENLGFLARVIDGDAQAFLVSVLFHIVLLLALAIFPIVIMSDRARVFVSASAPPEVEEFTIIDDVAISEEPANEVGANSDSETSMALSSAPVLAELSALPSHAFDAPALETTFDLTQRLDRAVALTRSDVVVKGMTGVGTTGTDGAVDQITYEILRSMEERPTLVVWFFDQSGSLLKRRQEIRDRFDRIYEELGIIQRSREELEQRKRSEEPLLTSVFAFGGQVNLVTPNPTADIVEIRDAIDSITMDSSGIERVFSALYKGVEKFRQYRSSRSSSGPKRNVLFIAVTDERGDDDSGLDATIKECRKYAIPVYVIGVPAPFGRATTYVKYVDPDTRFDQSPRWAEVDQGPESIMPERVKLGYRDNFFAEPVIDSGFGPYALSRLTYETGGIYFTVHPNRRTDRRVRGGQVEPFASRLEYFFDPEVMVKYRPDYLSREEYIKRVELSPLRQTLVRASQLARIDTLQNPTLRFIKRDDASLANALTLAQQQAARLEPQLAGLAQVLRSGEVGREREASPRWLAGFDLSLGMVLAHKVRNDAYNAMLAKAKRGIRFEKEKSNTWVLVPSDEISVGSRLEKDGKIASELLEDVAQKHKGTPWGLLATRELSRPIGWKWVEEFTDLNPPSNRRPGNNNNNNNPRPPSDDQARMLAKPPPTRPIPKL